MSESEGKLYALITQSIVCMRLVKNSTIRNTLKNKCKIKLLEIDPHEFNVSTYLILQFIEFLQNIEILQMKT